MKINIINKKLTLLTVILAIICITITSIAAVMFTTIPNRELNGGNTMPDNDGMANMGNADEVSGFDPTATPIDSVAIGSVLGGSEAYKLSTYYEADGTTVKAGYKAINNIVELRAFMDAGEGSQGHAFLTAPIDSYKAYTNSNDSDNTPKLSYGIKAGASLDACGYTITFGYKIGNWSDTIWSGESSFGLFAGQNHGTLKNAQFVNPSTSPMLMTDGNHSGTTYHLGGLIGFNRQTGVVDNVSFALNSEIAFHTATESWGGWSQITFGGMIGENSGSVSNVRFDINPGAKINLHAKYGNGIGVKSHVFYGGIVGKNVNGNIKNIVYNNNGRFSRTANGEKGQGGVCGEFDGGTIDGAIISGTGEMAGDSLGVYVGRWYNGNADSIKNGYNDTKGTSFIGAGSVGGGTYSGNFYHNYYDSASYDIKFSKSDSTKIILTQKGGAAGDIFWNIDYASRNNEAQTNNFSVAHKVISNAAYLPKFSIFGNDAYKLGFDLRVSYGSYAEVSSINAGSTIYNGNNQEATLTLNYVGKDGSFTTTVGQSYYNLLYNGKDLDGVKDAGAYNITAGSVRPSDDTSIVYYNNVDRIIARNTNSVVGVLNIDKATINASANSFTLNNPSKTYDGTTLYSGGITLAQNATGIKDETFGVTYSGSYYDSVISSGNDGGASKVIFNFALDEASSLNYKLNINQAELAATIVKMNITVTNAHLQLSNPNKEYDGTADYKGTITQNNIRGANGESITLKDVNGVYNSKNATGSNAADKITVTFGLADANTTNYALTNTELIMAGSITKSNISVMTESVTLSDRTKVYDNTVDFDKSKITVDNYTSDNGDVITIMVTSATYNTKDVSTANTITVSIAVDEESALNYELLRTKFTKNQATITPANLSITSEQIILSGNKVYDNTDSYTLAINQGIINGAGGEVITLVNMVGKYNSKNVSEATSVEVTFGLAEAYVGNYTYNNMIITAAGIDKATIEITADKLIYQASKTYDSTANYVGTITAQDLLGVGGEVISIKDIAGIFNNTDASGVNAATMLTITFALDDAYTGNYNANSSITVDATINKAKVDLNEDNITVTNTQKVYDGTDSFDINNIQLVNLPNAGDKEITVAISQAKYNSANTDATGINIMFELDAASEVNFTADDVLVTVGGSITPISLNVTYSNTIISYRTTDALGGVTVTVDKTGVLGSDIVDATITGVPAELPSEYKQYTIGAISSNINYTLNGSGVLTVTYFLINESGQYLIESIADFNMINTESAYKSMEYIQTTDIDAGYAMIKGVTGVFSGKYDGNNKSISNALMLNGSMFEEIAVGGSLSNLALYNTNVNNYIDGANVAAFVGINGGAIDNLVFQGYIYASTQDLSNTNVGSIVAINRGTLTNSKSIATINVIAVNAVVGGIAAVNSGSITDALAFNNIAASGTAEVGNISTGDGSVTGNYLANSAYDNNEVVGAGAGTAKTYLELYTENAVVFSDMTLQNIMSTYMNKYNVSLDANMPIEISNLREFELINQYRFMNFKLTSNIVFHKYYDHVGFGGGMAGVIDMNGFTIALENIF